MLPPLRWMQHHARNTQHPEQSEQDSLLLWLQILVHYVIYTTAHGNAGGQVRHPLPLVSITSPWPLSILGVKGNEWGKTNRRAWWGNEEAEEGEVYFSIGFSVMWTKACERKFFQLAEIDFSSTLSWKMRLCTNTWEEPGKQWDCPETQTSRMGKVNL